MASQEIHSAVEKPVQTLQIIVAALVMGCVSFLAVVLVVLPAGKAEGMLLTWLALAFAAGSVVACFLLPAAIASKGRKELAASPLELNDCRRDAVGRRLCHRDHLGGGCHGRASVSGDLGVHAGTLDHRALLGIGLDCRDCRSIPHRASRGELGGEPAPPAGRRAGVAPLIAEALLADGSLSKSAIGRFPGSGELEQIRNASKERPCRTPVSPLRSGCRSGII